MTDGGGRQVHLDVREDIRLGHEPFARIMAAVRALEPGEVLVLRAPFEPVPLYRVLGQQGFAHRTEQRAHDDWSVCFYLPSRESGTDQASGERSKAPPEPRSPSVDVRGLEAPLPMMRVLEAVERLAPGESVEILHERRPVFLYPQLEERGLLHETDEPAPGVVRIVIRRPGAGS
jgi:uncharacterized protein (DUF2249 family)